MQVIIIIDNFLIKKYNKNKIKIKIINKCKKKCRSLIEDRNQLKISDHLKPNLGLNILKKDYLLCKIVQKL